MDIQHDKWYQVKLTFECTEGNYSGLGKYHWKALINGTEYINLGFLNSGAVKNFCLSTVNLDSDYEVYVYNLNFSWAPTLKPEYCIFKYLIFFEHLRDYNITYFVFSEEETQHNQNAEAYIDIENELIAKFFKNKLYEYKYLKVYSTN